MMTHLSTFLKQRVKLRADQKADVADVNRSGMSCSENAAVAHDSMTLRICDDQLDPYRRSVCLFLSAAVFIAQFTVHICGTVSVLLFNC